MNSSDENILYIAKELLKETLKNNGELCLRVNSDSMKPLLSNNDEVFIENSTIEQLNTGDIVIIEQDDKLIVHRFWRMIKIDNRKKLLLYGDNLIGFDSPVEQEQFWGIVRRIKKYNGEIGKIGEIIILDKYKLNHWLVNLTKLMNFFYPIKMFLPKSLRHLLRYLRLKFLHWCVKINIT